MNIEVKICGITNESDAVSAAQAGADYLGYIMNYPASARYMRPAEAKKIMGLIRKLYPSVQHVGVFVDATTDTVNMINDDLQFDVIQLHGMEDPAVIGEIKHATTWKAIELKSMDDLAKVDEYRDTADVLMVDAGKGAGVLIDEELLLEANLPAKLILAGGLQPNNVVARIEQVQPTIIDVSSGVEAIPGKKDPIKLKELFAAIEHLR